MTSKIEVSREWLGDLQTFLEEAFDGGLAGIAQEECGIQIEYVRALLAAPEAPRQSEPVAFLCKSEGAKWLQYHEKVGDPWKPDEVELTPLYAAPLSPDHSGGGAGVVLPDVDVLAQIIRAVDGNHSLGAGALAERIIDKVKELNQ